MFIFIIIYMYENFLEELNKEIKISYDNIRVTKQEVERQERMLLENEEKCQCLSCQNYHTRTGRF